MTSAARLERLRQLTQTNITALPDQVLKPTPSNDDVSGGVSLLPPSVVALESDAPHKQANTDPLQPDPTPITKGPNPDRRYIWIKEAESAYNPAPMSKASNSAPQQPLPLSAIDLNCGQLASPQQHYTPIQALARYPYRFCDKSNSQDIASAFFDQGKFWDREWDLYYVWDIENPAKPLILITESQFQHLLDEINTHLGLELRITDQQRQDALVSRFPDHPRCTPRYLGRSQSREDYESMVKNAPDHDFRAVGELEGPPLDERSLEAFKQLMEESFDAQRAKNKATKAKKQQERLLKQKTMTDQFKRAQRYLGLRPSPARGAPPASGLPATVDPVSPVPFDFDQSVVFICVDVESYERAHHKITEVGIATLDTRELATIPPGQDGEGWRALIRARHFRIKEHAHLVNHEFVQGHPEGFDFGTSTIVPLADAPVHVAACFSPPFGAHHSNGADNVLEMLKGIDLNEKRNIIFLGHDTLGDVRYLQNLGYDPMTLENMLEALDTALLYRVWRREQNATSLGRILYDFDIAGYKLHNAGNDAVFTVQAMLGICVREATLRGTREFGSMRNSEKSARLAEALEDAHKKANDETEGWSDHDLEGDGGAPVPISLAPPKAASAAPLMQSNGYGRGEFQGRGRGRGGSHGGLYNPQQSSESYSDPGKRGDRSYRGSNGGRGRGGYERGSGGQGRGDKASHARGRGRGNAYSADKSVAEQQVHYYW